MNQLFKYGEILNEGYKKYRILNFLGSGNQGEVYKVAYEGKEYALKWYFKSMATKEQKENLIKLINIGAPDNRFLWPIKFIENSKKTGFGYIMPLRTSRYRNISDMMTRKIEPSFSAVLTACIELCDSFLKLHKMNLCYKDISFGNIFFDPLRGDILICDNDNVVENGKKNGVLGTPRFMAPEVVIGRSQPNIKSDLFSLSILLFYLLVMHHPLEGKKESTIRCFDLPAMTELYGKNPIFIFDPINKTNRPDVNYHKNALVFWPIYPEKLKDQFIQTFTKGIRIPDYRVDEIKWRDVSIETKNSLLYCNCGAENFYDRKKYILNNREIGKCWNCEAKIPQPARIKIDNEVIMLNSNTKLFNHHLCSDKKYDFRNIAAEVNKHPLKEDIFGLKNKTNIIWEAKLPSGKNMQVYPGKNIAIQNGLKLSFGTKNGEIRI